MTKGAYFLIIKLGRNRRISVGKLGRLYFKKGYYCYVGSALNNLTKRIERHKSKKKKLRWHIDYFLRYGKIIGVVKIKTNRKIECKLSKKIDRVTDSFIKGFGCCDCKCRSHLYYSKNKPKLKWILKN